MPPRQVLALALAILAVLVLAGSLSDMRAESDSSCRPGDGGACLWPAVSDEDNPRQQQKLQKGEPGLVGRDGQPVPDHRCVDCHDETDLLPPDHPPTAGMSMRGCRACHGTAEAGPLHKRVFQSHTHFFADVGCADCHADPDDPEEPETAVCSSCHGTLEELAARTAHVAPHNPHRSPHGAPYAECGLCHFQHEPPDNFCAACHDFDFAMP